MTREAAEVIGLQCLTWLAGNEDLLPVFMGTTGAGQEEFRERVQDPDFLGSILDFILMDDAWVQAFCAAQDLPGEAPMRARSLLPGGEQINWT